MNSARRTELVSLFDVGVQQLRRAAVSWRDPRARLLRRRRRAVRALWWRCGIAVIAGLAAVLVGMNSQALTLSTVGLGALACIAAVGAGSAGVRAHRLHRMPLPQERFVPPQLPPAGSLAREPMQRLSGATQSLDELLRQLAAPVSGMSSMPLDVVAGARASAAGAAAALHAVALRLRAVELARDAAPPLERGPLVADVRRLRSQLDEGVDGYGRLVAAAGRAVAATSSVHPQFALTEATEHLAGLASALRELSGDNSAQ